MVALRGLTDEEDILTNLGGMLAAVVVLVPTPGPGGCRSVRSPSRRRRRTTGPPTMVAGTGGLLAITFVAGWGYGILVLEALLIVLFAVFWLIQTVERWHVTPAG